MNKKMSGWEKDKLYRLRDEVDPNGSISDMLPYEKSLMDKIGRLNCEYYDRGPCKWMPCYGADHGFHMQSAYRPKALIAGFGHLPSRDSRHDQSKSDEEIEESILFHGPATIVRWKDGTKTVAKVSDSDTFDPVMGYLVCFYMKHAGETKTQTGKFFDYLSAIYNEESTYE